MEIDISLPLKAKAKLRANSYESSTLFPRLARLEVRSVGSDDAPLFVTWKDVEIRWYRERCYRRVFDRPQRSYRSEPHDAEFDYHDNRKVLSADEVRQALRERTYNANFTKGLFDTHQSKVEERPPEKFKSCVFDEAEAEADVAKARRWLEQVLVVDGEFFIWCPYPTYTLTNKGMLPQTASFDTTRFPGRFEVGYGRFGWNHTFAPDEADLGTALMEGYGHEVAPEGLMTVHAPQFLLPKGRTAGRCLTEAVNAFYGGLADGGGRDKSGLRSLSPPVLRALATLQETVHGRKLGDIDPDDLADAFEACLDSLRGVYTEARGGDTVTFRMAIRRVRERPILFGDDGDIELYQPRVEVPSPDPVRAIRRPFGARVDAADAFADTDADDFF